MRYDKSGIWEIEVEVFPAWLLAERGTEPLKCRRPLGSVLEIYPPGLFSVKSTLLEFSLLISKGRVKAGEMAPSEECLQHKREA